MTFKKSIYIIYPNVQKRNVPKPAISSWNTALGGRNLLAKFFIIQSPGGGEGGTEKIAVLYVYVEGVSIKGWQYHYASGACYLALKQNKPSKTAWICSIFKQLAIKHFVPCFTPQNIGCNLTIWLSKLQNLKTDSQAEKLGRHSGSTNTKASWLTHSW